MDRWKSALALTVAGALAAGTAFAQATSPTPPSDKPSSAEQPKGKPMGAAPAGMNREQVKKAQQALKDKGHYDGEVDGAMGPKTQAAMKKFQKAEGIQETGRLDSETMARLGLQASSSSDASGSSASPRTDSGAPGSSGSSSPSGTTPSATSPSGASTPSGASGGSATPGAKSNQTR